MKARWIRTCGVLLACATLTTFAACGDDDGGDAGVAGTGAAGTAGSSGASGGGAGSAGKAGGGAGMGGPVTCGTQMCTVNSTLKIVDPRAAACCTTDNKCGQYNGSMKCLPVSTTPVKLDKSCPDLSFSITVMGAATPVTQKGCCLPNNMCGNDYSMVGWGCVARPEIDMSMGATMGALPALMCGMGGDGGAADAGI